MENIILNSDITVKSNGQPTHYHSQINSYSVMDLTLGSSDFYFDFDYRVPNSLHGSDHYPTELELYEPQYEIPHMPNSNVERQTGNCLRS